MLTVDYEFYTGTYHGTLSEAEFSRLSVFAAAWLDEMTLGRITGEMSETDRRLVSLALCALCDARGTQEERDGIAGESNDGVSVSYVTEGAGDGSRLYAAAAVYLAPTGLLYRGVV